MVRPPSSRPSRPGEGEFSAALQKYDDPCGWMVSSSWKGGITIVSAGGGYTSTPTITIANPPLAGGYAYIRPGVLLGMNNLMTNQIYELQYAQQLSNAWLNLNNGYLLTVNTNQSQYIFITNSSAYYRLQYVP